jgi:hypothetical protein
LIACSVSAQVVLGVGPKRETRFTPPLARAAPAPPQTPGAPVLPPALPRDLFRSRPDTYAPRHDRSYASFFPYVLTADYPAAPIERATTTVIVIPAPPAVAPVASIIPQARLAPLAPVAPKPFYVIPRCYAGDTPPRENLLPAGCSTANLRTILPAAGRPFLEQEREIPKDSALVTLRGCARDRAFIVGPRSEDSPASLEIAPGRRFRMSGSKSILADIRKRERMMVEITGLVRKSDVAGPGGISLGGGRVRIGGGNPQSSVGAPGRDSAYNQAVIDVESWRSLLEPCPSR